MPPIAEHVSIIKSFVKKPPAERLFTKNKPAVKVRRKISTPQSRPVFIPFFLFLLAAVKLAAKHPAHNAALDIAVNAPSDRSMTEAIPENVTEARKTAPTQASAA